MKNVYILCEGQTEETFVNEILQPYFSNLNIYVHPIVCTTRQTASKKYKGGASDYKKIKKELSNLCKEHHSEIVTTMFDYYGIDKNSTPSIDNNEQNIFNSNSSVQKDNWFNSQLF